MFRETALLRVLIDKGRTRNEVSLLTTNFMPTFYSSY